VADPALPLIYCKCEIFPVTPTMLLAWHRKLTAKNMTRADAASPAGHPRPAASRASPSGCSLAEGHPVCKGPDPTPPNHLFLGPSGGHLRRSNFAVRDIAPPPKAYT
jgi:hypothetical protein